LLTDSSSGGGLTARAGGDLIVPNGKTINAAGLLRLIADNQNATPPAIGSGGITVGSGAKLSGAGAIQLYGAHRSDNSIAANATFNGATFTPGDLFAPSDRERWGVYAPGGTATTPFTFFYKDTDSVEPTITLLAPLDGATYTVGDAVPANYSCADDVHVASCSGTVPSGSAIDTSSVGSQTFTVEAVDNAGNKASKTVTYVVNATADVTPPPVVDPPVTTPPPAPPHAQVSGKKTAKLRRAKHKLVTGLFVTCPKGLPRRCGGSGKVTANVPRNVAARVVTIGKVGFAVKPGRSKRVVIELTPRGPRILARVKTVKITLRVTTRGLDGRRVVTNRTFTLRVG
jgi:hypothetical protein